MWNAAVARHELEGVAYYAEVTREGFERVAEVFRELQHTVIELVVDTAEREIIRDTLDAAMVLERQHHGYQLDAIRER